MPDSPLQTALTEYGALVLDGAMATELERHGADLSGALWSARLLLERPEIVARVHTDYFAAGADVAVTAGYQASVPGFVAAGVDPDQAQGLVASSVELARRARDDFWRAAVGDDPEVLQRRPRPVVATSVGPYGAVLADGSEYRGDYAIGHRDLVRFHRERLAILVDAGVEVLACETIPSLAEATALLEALADWPDVTAWVSFSARNGSEVSDGTPITQCADLLGRQPQVVAVGVNCTPLQHVGALVRLLTDATDLPVVVYPNSGEVYDASRKGWQGSRSSGDYGRHAEQWYADGARLVGGCCRTGPEEVAAVRNALPKGRRRP